MHIDIRQPAEASRTVTAKLLIAGALGLTKLDASLSVWLLPLLPVSYALQPAHQAMLLDDPSRLQPALPLRRKKLRKQA